MNTASRAPAFSPSLRAVASYFRMDGWLLAATSFLLAVGLSTLKWSQEKPDYFDKQAEFMWVGLLLMAVFSRIPYRFWTGGLVVIAMYVVNLLLLLAVMVKGHAAQGAQRWLALGPITLQPSEIAKLVVIFSLAAWLGRRPIRSFFDIFKLVAVILPPAVLVFKQPDLGTSLTFGAVFLGMSYWAGATLSDLLVMISPLISLILNALDRDWWLAFSGGLAAWLLLFWRRRTWNIFFRLVLVIIVVAVNLGSGFMRPHLWGMLKEYQQKRLTSFVNPYVDPRGSGYHILQSLIAIGGGGIIGTGLGKGNQSQGAFIPERHTDFIFAVVGEELGYKVTFFVILAYGIICIRAIRTAVQSRADPTASALSIGIMSMFLFHVFLNLGMTMGIMPVAGVPLPFLSYGGTALLVDLVSIGLLQSIQFGNPAKAREDVLT